MTKFDLKKHTNRFLNFDLFSCSPITDPCLLKLTEVKQKKFISMI